MATIKYPGYRKNAQGQKKGTIPRFDNRVVITYNKPMQYYYVMCKRDSLTHRAYVQLDSESADILHDSLEQRYDLVQVCPVPKSQLESDLLIK